MLGVLSNVQSMLVKFWIQVAISELGPDIVGRVPRYQVQTLETTVQLIMYKGMILIYQDKCQK